MSQYNREELLKMGMNAYNTGAVDALKVLKEIIDGLLDQYESKIEENK